MRFFQFFRIDITGHDLGTGGFEPADQMAPHLPHPLHCNQAAFEIIGPENLFCTGLDSLKNAERGERRRIAGTPVGLFDAGHIVGLGEGIFHVVDIGADIFRGDIPAIQ